MAYSRMSDAVALHDPLILHCNVVNNNSADTVINVPYNDVRCVYIYSTVGVAISGGDMVLTIRRHTDSTKASGTTFATMTVADAAAVGVVDEATISNAVEAAKFGINDYITFDINGGGTPGGEVNLYFYFEPIL